MSGILIAALQKKGGMCAECRAEGAADAAAAARERKQTAAHFLIGAGSEEISSFYDSAPHLYIYVAEQWQHFPFASLLQHEI
jgi:hypothetical protein